MNLRKLGSASLLSLSAALLPVGALAGGASTCTQGGTFVMVFSGAMLGDEGGASLQRALMKALESKAASDTFTWQTTGGDMFGLIPSLQDVLGDLAAEDNRLALAADQPALFLAGSLINATAARDASLPVIGEFFAQTRNTEEDARRISDAAYQQLSAELKTGKRVLLIGYSDGTYAMQAAYDRLVGEFGTQGVGRYSVAPLSAGGDYVSASSDLVVKAVRAAPGSTAPAPNVSSTTTANDLFGHNPTLTYLQANSGLRTKIQNDLSRILDGLQGDASPSNGGLVTISVKPAGDFTTVMGIEVPESALGLGSPERREIRPNVEEDVMVIPCNTPSAWAGEYKVAVRFGSGAKPGDEAIVAVTRPGRGTQTKRVKAPICNECIEYDANDKPVKVVDSWTYVPAVTVRVDVPAQGQASTSDHSASIGSEILLRARPSWRTSENDVGHYYNTTMASIPAYEPQVTFLGSQRQITAVAGSVRPDWTQDNKDQSGTDIAVEVKNYNLAKNRSKLLSVLNTQLAQRKSHLRSGAQQVVYIDLRGQRRQGGGEFGATDWQMLKQDIVSANRGILTDDTVRYVGQEP